MKNPTLVNRYAEGLALALADDAEYGRVAAELRELTGLFREHPDLRRLLESPLLTAGRKAEAVRDVLDRSGISDKARRFILLILEHNRLSLLADILDALALAWDEKKGIVSFEVTSAVPLSEAQKRELAARLERLEKTAVRLSYSRDAAVLGGLTVRKGNLVYDASLKGRLDRLRAEILEG
jgi:F-type H+-transporting ATPase subunit delta